ncbi:hypothetical protein LCGC14_2341660 [marine sediment metagenome]|uniref:Uncharacterized protein n=1 Tax=marine sediment metagenome TaxID=412755 RepID=A0A0F9CCP3_9ZZZZ
MEKFNDPRIGDTSILRDTPNNSGGNMNIYLISQNKVRGYDTYDSAVVIAKTAKKARKTHPNQSLSDPWNKEKQYSLGLCWANNPKYVTSKLIGKAKVNSEAGVICSSFNAG